MNFGTLFVVPAVGFGVSFLVLDVSRMIGRGHWPVSDATMAANFRPLAVFLALFAGPALFVQAVWQMRASSRLGLIDGVVALAISFGWAICYGIVVTQGVRCFGLALHL